MKKRVRNRQRVKSVNFKPSHDFLSKAVDEYLASGGTITKLEVPSEVNQDNYGRTSSAFFEDDEL